MRDCRLDFDFWNRHPTEVATALIGCTVSMRQADGIRIGGRIVETEAYHHTEAACHAYRFENRTKSPRVEHFFGPAGFSYVYLNYGIHKLLNVITGPDDDGSAVLIRAIEPLTGINQMREFRNHVADKDLCNGPGKLTQALGIDLCHNKLNICSRQCSIEFNQKPDNKEIATDHGPRVGISKATELKWRFVERGNASISKASENKRLKAYR